MQARSQGVSQGSQDPPMEKENFKNCFENIKHGKFVQYFKELSSIIDAQYNSSTVC
jgi:hypothetical protein